MSAVSDVVAIGFSGTVEKVRYFVYSEIMRRWPVRLNRVSPRPDTSENKQRKKKKNTKKPLRHAMSLYLRAQYLE